LAGKLTPKAHAQLAVLAEARRKVDHLRALVEQASAMRSGTFGSASQTDQAKQEAQQRLLSQVARMANDIAQILGERGFTQFASDIQELVQLARRGGRAPLAAMHRMRELVGTVSSTLDIAERDVTKDGATAGNSQ
jgi:predicted urease superfamily metal-dependent hydrolase